MTLSSQQTNLVVSHKWNETKANNLETDSRGTAPCQHDLPLKRGKRKGALDYPRHTSYPPEFQRVPAVENSLVQNDPVCPEYRTMLSFSF